MSKTYEYNQVIPGNDMSWQIIEIDTQMVNGVHKQNRTVILRGTSYLSAQTMTNCLNSRGHSMFTVQITLAKLKELRMLNNKTVTEMGFDPISVDTAHKESITPI